MVDTTSCADQWNENRAVWKYVNQRGIGVVGDVTSAVFDNCERAMTGEGGRAAGRCAFDVASVLAGPKGLDKIAKSAEIVGKSAEIAGDAARVGRAAEGIGIVVEKARPVLEISRSRMPTIAENIATAQRSGAPKILTREGDSAVIDANRRAACSGICGFESIDEYPFASTKEGGKASRVADVPQLEQWRQGGVMHSFYQRFNVKNGDTFEVRVTP